MKEDLGVSWSWLLPEQQRILRENPSGPVPKELVPRLHEYGLLGVGTKYVTSPTGVRQTFLAPGWCPLSRVCRCRHEPGADPRPRRHAERVALMLAYGISADRAFDGLVWRSHQTNTKVREIAQNLVTGIARDGIDPAAVQATDRPPAARLARR